MSDTETAWVILMVAIIAFAVGWVGGSQDW